MLLCPSTQDSSRLVLIASSDSRSTSSSTSTSFVYALCAHSDKREPLLELRFCHSRVIPLECGGGAADNARERPQHKTQQNQNVPTVARFGRLFAMGGSSCYFLRKNDLATPMAKSLG